MPNKISCKPVEDRSLVGKQGGEKEASSAVFVIQVSDTIVFIEIFQRKDVINAVFVTQIECE